MRIDEEPDGLDVVAIEEMLLVPAYRMIIEHLQKAHQQTVKSLLNARDWDEARQLQGMARGLEFALGAPDAIIQEIRSQQQQAGKRKRQ